VTGVVTYVDHFGNAITSLRPERLGNPASAELQVFAEGTAIRGPIKSYGEGAPECPIMVLGSWGYFEVAMNGDSAALLLGLQRGSVVIVSLPATTPAA
jgi:S-adenosylmethionine hydrolase